MTGKEGGILRTVFGVVVLFVLVACTTVVASGPALHERTTPVSTQPLPEHLLSVWPPSNQPVSEMAYSDSSPFVAQRGVGARVSGFVIDQPSLVPSPPIASRVSLLINGTPVANDTLHVEDELGVIEVYDEQDVYLGNVYTGPFGVSWLPPLGKGTHTATLQVESNTGNLLEYSWEFRIK